MTKILTERVVFEPNTDFIVSEDIAAQKLLKEIYSNLKVKDPSDLSISEHCWMQSIENLYSDKKSSISNKVDWYVQIGRDLIEEEKSLNSEEKAMLSSFRRVLDVSAKNNSLTTFFAELEDAVEALFRLDFSRGIQIPDSMANDDNDLLSYIVMMIEMIRERLGQSVVSGKVMRSVLGTVSNMGVLVTDEQGRIRFANDKMEEIVAMNPETLIGNSISAILDKNSQLLEGFKSDDSDEIEIQQFKVPSVDGQLDEWTYMFTKKEDKIVKIDRMEELRTLINELHACDRNDTVQMNVLLEVLRAKFDRVDQETIYDFGLQPGTNLRMLLEECLMDVRQKDDIEILVDSNDKIAFFGESDQLKTLMKQVLSSADENLTKSPKQSKMEVVVSSFQHYLLISVMDNGAPMSNYTLLQKMRDDVSKMEGTLELNSGRMGNNLTIILPA